MTNGEARVPAVLASDERRHGSRPRVDTERWAEFARAVLLAEGAVSGELGLLFVDPDEMARLNREHLGEDRPTDVLAFPLDGADESDPPTGPALIGDVVVCPAYVSSAFWDECGSIVRSGAGDRGSVLDDALALRVVHGVLHVLGYDHADTAEAVVMKERERDLLECHFSL